MRVTQDASSIRISRVLLSDVYLFANRFDFCMKLGLTIPEYKLLNAKLISNEIRSTRFMTEVIKSWCSNSASPKTLQDLYDILVKCNFTKASVELLSSSFENLSISIHPEDPGGSADEEYEDEGSNFYISFAVMPPSASLVGVLRLKDMIEISNGFRKSEFSVAAIIGSSGSGKSELLHQLALSQVAKLRDEFHFVVFNAESQLAFLKSMQNFAATLGCLSPEQNQVTEILQFIHLVIENDGRKWIICFENVAKDLGTIAEALKYLSRVPNVYLIITTVRSDFIKTVTIGSVINLTEFAEEEIVTFITHKNSYSAEDAMALVHLIKFNPTALHICMSFMTIEQAAFHHQNIVTDYMRRYCECRDVLEALEIPKGSWDNAEIGVCVYVTLNRLGEIQANSALELLNFLILLDNSRIEVAFLERLLVPRLIAHSEEDGLQASLNLLLKYGLILMPNGESLVIQPSVRNALKILLSNSYTELHKAAIKLLIQLIPFINSFTNEHRDDLYQALAICKNTNDINTLQRFKEILQTLLLKFRICNRWTELLLHCVDIKEKHQDKFDSLDPKILSVSAFMGEAYNKIGFPHLALPILEEVYPKLRKVIKDGDKSTLVGATANELATLYVAKKEYEKALVLYNRNVEGERELSNVEYNPNICIGLQNIAEVLFKQERFEEALTRLQEVKEFYALSTSEIKKELIVENKHFLSKVCSNLQLPFEAYQYSVQAANVLTSICGRYDPKMLKLRFTLARCQFKLPNIFTKVGAIRSMRQLLVDAILVFGKDADDPNTIRDELIVMGSHGFEWKPAGMNDTILEKLLQLNKRN